MNFLLLFACSAETKKSISTSWSRNRASSFKVERTKQIWKTQNIIIYLKKCKYQVLSLVLPWLQAGTRAPSNAERNKRSHHERKKVRTHKYIRRHSVISAVRNNVVPAKPKKKSSTHVPLSTNRLFPFHSLSFIQSYYFPPAAASSALRLATSCFLASTRWSHPM